MEDTWGIPEPMFVGIYLLGFSISLLFAFAVRILTRSGAAISTTAPMGEVSALSALELACLTGGPRRVVEAAVAQLVETGQLRASRDGYLQIAGRDGGTNPVERTVLADVARHGRRSISMLTDRLAGADAVGEVAVHLVRSGYLVDGDVAAKRKLIGIVPVLAVFGLGVLQWLSAIANIRPVGTLTVVLAVTGLITYLLFRQPACARTFTGAIAVGRVRATAAAELVAVGGFPSHPDRTIREALLARRRGVTSGGASGCGTDGSCKG